uniref:CHCH domain-containing protein n=1 Tax=Setaria digitata TaxID=48799 RepID=A0A915Q0Q1_9BILA
MSNKAREITALRPSLKKQQAHSQVRPKESDGKRHVTFASPKLPSLKCNLKQQPTSDQGILKLRKQKSVVGVHRKRIPSAQIVELRAKKNKHNEQIVRLCEAEEALVRSEYVIKRMGKDGKEQERSAAELLQNAVSLIETDNLLDNIEHEQREAARKLQEELVGINKIVATLKKVLITIEKYSETLNMELKSSEEEKSVIEEMRLLDSDINQYLAKKMVRRRMASPKPSPPVHRRASSPISARSPPSVPVQTRTPTAPSTTTPQFGMAPPSQGPGLMGQMAATAGGVAIGSAVGHAVGNMLTGGGGGHGNRDEVLPSEKQQMTHQQYKNPCEFEWKQFIECTETQSDLSLCQSFNEIFKQCRANNP